MSKEPAVAIRSVDDVNVSPYERTRGRAKWDLGFGVSRVPFFMHVVTFWASQSWTYGKGKGSPESESNGDSAHSSWSSRKVQGLLTGLVGDGEEGQPCCVFIYQSWPNSLMAKRVPWDGRWGTESVLL